MTDVKRTRIRSLIAFGSAIALFGLALPSGALAGDTEAGKLAFQTNCSSCHGMTGKGDGPVGPALPVPPRDLSAGVFKFDTDKDGKTGTDADLKNVIQKGGAAYGGSALMAPWPTLNDADIANIIAFIRTLKQ